MPVRSGLVAVAVAMCGLVGSFVEAAEREAITPTLEVQHLAPGVWRVVSEGVVEGQTDLISANALLVISGEAAGLIDTPWTALDTAALFNWAADRLGVEIGWVAATHSHPDRLGGLAAAHARGAESYGHELTASLAREQALTAPMHTFTDRLDLAVGKRTVELRYLGAGHTVDNTVAWIADQGILFGGCLIKSGQSTSLGYTEEADLNRWPITLEAVAREFSDAVMVVPGHGSPSGTDALQRTRDLLTDSIHAQAAVHGAPFFIALSVADIDRSTTWYREVFGALVRREIEMPDRGVRIRMLRSPTGLIELIEHQSAESRAALLPDLVGGYLLHGVFKTGVSVADLEEAISRLESLGIPLRGQVYTEEDGSMRSTQIEDPDGNVIQIFQLLEQVGVESRATSQ